MTPRGSTRRALLAGLLLAACTRHAAPSQPADARRVVSLAPSTTEALFAVGAGDRVVGRSTFCDYPPEATRLPAVGGVQPDVEAILELHPDLVVGLAGAGASRTSEKLVAHGIPTWFSADASLADIDTMILGVGARTAHASRAHEVVGSLDAQIEAVQRAVAAQSRPGVLMVVGTTPVVVAGPRSFADELLGRAGAVNVVREGEAWQSMSLERVAELDPDLILDAAGGEGPAHVTPGTPGWGGLRAVREGRVVRLQDERVLRAGPRIGEGLAILAKLLHPGLQLP